MGKYCEQHILEMTEYQIALNTALIKPSVHSLLITTSEETEELVIFQK